MPYAATHIAIRAVSAVLALTSAAAAGASEVSPAEGQGAFDAKDDKDRKIGTVTKLMLPVVVNTWTGDFSRATERAWDALSSGGPTSSVLDAIEQVREDASYTLSPRVDSNIASLSQLLLGILQAPLSLPSHAW